MKFQTGKDLLTVAIDKGPCINKGWWHVDWPPKEGVEDQKKEEEEQENTMKRKKNDSAKHKKSRDAKQIALEAKLQKNPSLKSQLKIRG